MLDKLEFYACLVFMAVCVVIFLLFLVRLAGRYKVAMALIVIAFAFGLITGPWLFTFVVTFSSFR